MTGRSGRTADYLKHMLAAIARIEAYVDGLGTTDFVNSTLVQDAVIRNFEIFGEAANKLQSVDPAFAVTYPSLKLEQAYRMRNALAHGYDAVNLQTVWNTIVNDLPSLKQQANDILQDLK